MRSVSVAIPLKCVSSVGRGKGPQTFESLLKVLGVDRSSPEALAQSLPFSLNDTTAGSENELQTCVIGKREEVDLPLIIEESGYYHNILKRFKAGETPRRAIIEIEKYLRDNPPQIWENSWVRFPRTLIRERTDTVFKKDLLADKKNPQGPLRNDLDKFIFTQGGEELIRVPVSYLLKLALMEALYDEPGTHRAITETGEAVAGHFLNDNTSPETYSFHPVFLNESSRMGMGLARETAKRFLLSQFLVMYANLRFRLAEGGQRIVLYFAPHPPVRQKMLNESISDSFYRELFMNPCLSGWDRGEEKFRYMGLCHQVLSRSQLNVIPKLKESGIIVNNLVVLPNLSNISLANNGTHVSLGSLRLTRLLKNPNSGFGPEEEKRMGDLTIKIVEHFLPLFVGTYSAAPYRLDFWDFHPEKALGFLPHELDYTHLRMIWRRWLGKAHLKVFGKPLTPFGPRWIDVLLSRLFSLKGDFVPDFRLIDYLVALMSTDNSPALDGSLNNGDRLKQDLANLGVFDTSMALYLLYRLRACSQIGFSGFEGRHYSLFESLAEDMSEAVNLQVLITALAFQYQFSGECSHEAIPDDPNVESERRQVFFGASIGLPTFYIHKNTPNRFILKILEKTARTRLSRRYPGYIRVYRIEYLRALVTIIEEDGRELIALMGFSDTLRDLKARLEDPRHLSAAGRLTRGILQEGNASTPLKLSGHEFNLAAEKYYREHLRKRHMEEALAILETDFMRLDSHTICGTCLFREGLQSLLGNRNALTFLNAVRKDVLEERAPEAVLRKLIHLTLLTIYSDQKQGEAELTNRENHGTIVNPSVY
jgi:hypothetical protein